jgi:putative oxidoreductase
MMLQRKVRQENNYEKPNRPRYRNPHRNWPCYANILGAFVTLASLPMAAVLLVAMFTVHLPYGFSSIKLQAVTAAGGQFGPPGYEVNLLYLACLAALVLGGPGPLTIDGLIRKGRKVRSS